MMSKIKRRIAKTAPAAEPTSPRSASIALVASCAAVGVVLLYRLSWTDPRPWANGLFLTATLAATTSLAIILAARTPPRTSRRLQYAGAASVLFHLALALMLETLFLRSLAQFDGDREPLLEEQEEKIPEVFEFPRRTEAVASVAELTSEAPTPSAAEATAQPEDSAAASPSPTSLAAATPSPTPAAIDRPESPAASPRRRPSMSQLSRSLGAAEAPSERVAEMNPSPTSSPRQPTASAAEVARSESSRASSASPSSPNATTQVTAASPSRAAGAPQMEATPAPQRAVAQVDAPSVDVPSESPSVAASAADATPSPAATDVAQRSSSPTTAEPLELETAPAGRPTASQIARAEPAQQPSVAASAPTQRTATAADSPSAVDTDVAAADAPAASGAAGVSASAAEVAEATRGDSSPRAASPATLAPSGASPGLASLSRGSANGPESATTTSGVRRSVASSSDVAADAVQAPTAGDARRANPLSPAGPAAIAEQSVSRSRGVAELGGASGPQTSVASLPSPADVARAAPSGGAAREPQARPSSRAPRAAQPTEGPAAVAAVDLSPLGAPTAGDPGGDPSPAMAEIAARSRESRGTSRSQTEITAADALPQSTGVRGLASPAAARSQRGPEVAAAGSLASNARRAAAAPGAKDVVVASPTGDSSAQQAGAAGGTPSASTAGLARSVSASDGAVALSSPSNAGAVSVASGGQVARREQGASAAGPQLSANSGPPRRSTAASSASPSDTVVATSATGAGQQARAAGPQVGRVEVARRSSRAPSAASFGGLLGAVPSVAQVGAGSPSRNLWSQSPSDGGAAANVGAARRAAPAAAVADAGADPLPSPSDLIAAGRSDADLLPGELASTGAAPRPSAAPTEVAVASPLGVGGFGASAPSEIGLPSRRARLESEVALPSDARFLQRRPGGGGAIDGRVRNPTPGFRGRLSPATSEDLGPFGPQVDEAIERGLEFLARHQAVDGHWSLHFDETSLRPETQPIQSDTAATGLALLCFLGAGYDHFGDRYRDEVRQGIEFLVRGQSPTGDLYKREDDYSDSSAWLYSHAAATIALAEAYGMTGDAALREPVERAVRFIEESQHAEFGGWRYRPGSESDLSVSGWMMMALKSAETAGVAVDQSTYDRLSRFISSAEAPGTAGAQFIYNPNAPDREPYRVGLRPSNTMSSVGLLMRLYLGWDRSRGEMRAGAERLANRPPRTGFAGQRLRDTYYWYYATQVMYHMGGSYWRRWHERLHPLLIESQEREGENEGSWSPLGEVPDVWGPHAGRIYVTTMNLLSLEVVYRKLPLYSATLRSEDP